MPVHEMEGTNEYLFAMAVVSSNGPDETYSAVVFQYDNIFPSNLANPLPLGRSVVLCHVRYARLGNGEN